MDNKQLLARGIGSFIPTSNIIDSLEQNIEIYDSIFRAGGAVFPSNVTMRKGVPAIEYI